MKKALPLLCLISLTAHAELVDRIAAVVNNDIITLSDVEQRLGPDLNRLRYEPDASKRTEMRSELIKRGVELLIGERLMESQVRELNIEVTDSELDAGIDDVVKKNRMTLTEFEAGLAQEGFTLATYRTFLRKALARSKLINLKVRSKLKMTEDDLKAEYARWSRDQAADFEVHARQILVQVPGNASKDQVETSRQKALALMEEAKKAGVNFAELAKKKSEGPSAAEGGDLGFFKRGVMMADFERAAFTLPIGGISQPIRTKFGWHVLKVEERRALDVPPLEEVKDKLREQLGQQQFEKYTQQFVQELRAAAVVDVKI